MKSDRTPEFRPFLGGLCFITDRKLCGLTCEEMARTVLKAGAAWVQYREKEKTRREVYYEALRLRALSSEFNAAFIVNDYADIALAVDADGVHLGQEDLPLREARALMGKKLVGISTHSVSEAVDAERGGADYIGFGPVFFTATKDAGRPKGTDMLKEIRKHVRIPIVAIGGIAPRNIGEVIDSGADAIAAASAVLTGDISENVRAFMKGMGRNVK